jgi:hypothetical protein
MTSKNSNSIAAINAKKLANLTAGFCLINGITLTQELGEVIGHYLFTNFAYWYEEMGLAFNPAEEVINDEAIKYAFGKMQKLADLAEMSVSADADIR